MMSTSRGRLSKDANLTVHRSLTHDVIEAVQALSPSTRNSYLKDCFLTKFVSEETDPPSVRRQRAINKWLATERTNEATNERLLTVDGEYNILPRVTFTRFVDKCREIIANVVGELPEEDSFIGSFSGGASTSRRRGASFPAGKYTGKAHITADAIPWFESVYGSLPGWQNCPTPLDVEVVGGNVLFTVPKTTEIDRCACKEPDLNMFLQKGLGSTIRRNLRRVGINLNDQSINRDLARIGSIDGSLATLDLSAASDSVTYELVFLLMPFLWAVALDSLRCKVTYIDGVEHRNEMFSSMGNGFTFELESLLFYALARTTAYFEGVSGVISVYGDDIIVPSALSLALIDVLRFFGFETNASKSFWTGTFRESCGGHYDCGLDITPFYLRGPIRKLSDLMHVANAIRKWSVTPGMDILDPQLFSLWVRLRDQVPKRFWGGQDYETIYQLVTRDRPCSRLMPRRKSVTTGDGGLVHWLNSTDRRQSASLCGVEASERIVEHSSCRLVKADWTVPRLPHAFPEEVV